MKPKYQQTWNDNNTQLRINIKYDKPIQIEVLKQSGENIKENEPIGAYFFDEQKKNIISTFNGFIAWAQNAPRFIIESGDQFYTIGIIYKNKSDFPNLEDIEMRSTSSSIVPTNNYFKLNYTQLTQQNCTGCITVTKWKVNVGDFISPAMILGTCTEQNEEEIIDLRCKVKGKVIELAKTKQQYNKEETLIIIDGTHVCTHLKVENMICLFCHEKIIRKTETLDLNYTDDMLKKISKETVIDILNKKKLIMVLDLDQTILHAIKVNPNFNRQEFCDMQNKLNENNSYNGFNQLGFNIKEHFLEMYCDQTSKFIIKLRPYFEQFFLTLIPLYDIYIYTKASKSYADFILGYISNKLQEVIPEHYPFFPANRVFSREDTICINSKSLNRLFYPGIAQNFLVILDDNAGMWSQFSENLIHTKPFVYFQEHCSSKDKQGINIEIENYVEIYNKSDFWLYTTTQKLKEISDKFWNLIQIAQNDPNYIAAFETYQDHLSKYKKASKSIIEEIDEQNEERTLLDLIIKRKISAPKIYLEIRVNVLKGVTLFFAISEAHEANAKKGLEIAKEKAFFLGAKIFREFKENDFVGKANTFVITVGRRKIKSILIAQEKSIPIVHYKWIEDCDNYLYLADYRNYIENDNGENSHLDDENRDKILKSQLLQI